MAGALLFVVTGLVVLSSGLSLLGYREPKPSFAGIVLLIAAAIGLPWLAHQKRKLATQIGSPSLRADVNRICALRLSLLYRLGRIAGKCALSHPLGGPDSCVGSRATDRERRMARHPCFADLLQVRLQFFPQSWFPASRVLEVKSLPRTCGYSLCSFLPKEVHQFRVHFVCMRPIHGVRPIFYGH